MSSTLLNQLLSEDELFYESKKDDDEDDKEDEDDKDEDDDDDDDDKKDDEEELEEEISIKRMAIALGALDEDVDFDSFNEAVNIVKLNKQSKLASLASRTALGLAKRNGDPLYEKYAKFNGMRLQLRSQIFKKYGSKANQRARALMAGNASPLNPSTPQK